MKSLTDAKWKLLIAGAVCGIVAALLAAFGNPGNMAICVACFIRDIAGAFKLHSAAPVQYFRPEILGFVGGSFLISLATKEYKTTGGSSPMIRKASEPDDWEPYYDGAQQIYNPTLFASKPLIRVTGAGTVGIGDEAITIASGYDYVDIDSEIQNCYCGNQNANAAVTFSNRKFPELQPGLNGVTFGTGIESVQITPRWYRI